MKKSLLFLFVLSMVSVEVLAQLDTNWLRQYARTSLRSNIQGLEKANGDLLLFQAGDFYTLSPEGDSLDYQVYSGTLTLPQAVAEVSDGYYLGAGQTIVKVDTSLAETWTLDLTATGFGDVEDIYVGNGVNLACGRNGNRALLASFTDAGDTNWVTLLPQQPTFVNLHRIFALSDGNYLATGNVDDYPYAVKFNDMGDTLWTYEEQIFISLSRSSAYERSNGNLVLNMQRYLIELDADGNKLNEIALNRTTMNDMYVSGDTMYLAGTRFAPNSFNERYPIIELRNMNLDSLTTFRITAGVHPPAQNEFESFIPLSTGGVVAVGKIRDSIEINMNTYNLIAMKFNGMDEPPVGFEEIETSPFSVYPNPVSRSQPLVLELAEGQHHIQLFDISGKQVLNTQSVNTREVLDMAALTPGLYLLQVDGTHTRKLIVR